MKSVNRVRGDSGLQLSRRALMVAAGYGAVGAVLVAVSPAAAAQILLQVDASAVGGKGGAFDLAALDALPQRSFRTKTPWTSAADVYSGPSLQAILAASGVRSGRLKASAANDYSITMPVHDVDQTAPIVATRIDGKTFSLRDKGPLWILYPFDTEPKYRGEVNNSRCVWQLTKITVTPE